MEMEEKNIKIKMETITIILPKELIHVFKIRKKDLSKAVRESLAVELYRDGKISLGKAAEIAKMSKWEIFELLAAKKVPLQYYPEDLEQDISLALIHEGIERGLINQTLEEVTKKMRERKIWISDEIIEKVRSRARLDLSEV